MSVLGYLVCVAWFGRPLVFRRFAAPLLSLGPDSCNPVLLGPASFDPDCMDCVASEASDGSTGSANSASTLGRPGSILPSSAAAISAMAARSASSP